MNGSAETDYSADETVICDEAILQEIANMQWIPGSVVPDLVTTVRVRERQRAAWESRCDKLAAHVSWVAQTVHQAYHDGPGVSCPKDVCASTRWLMDSL